MTIYQNKTANEQILEEKRTTSIVEEIKYTNNGILVYIKDLPYPIKGMPTVEAVFANNIIKKLLLESVKTFGILFLFVSRDKLIKSFNIISQSAISPYLIKEEYLNSFSREIKDILSSVDEKFADIIAHLFEYDNAYRFRLQDILSETTKQKLIDRPYRETKRILKLMIQRDNFITKSRAEIFAGFIPLMLLIPKYRKQFRQALWNCDFERLQFDKGDRYWVAQRVDYEFFGMAHEKRLQQLKDLKLNLPIYE